MNNRQREELQAAIDIERQRRSTHDSRSLTINQAFVIGGKAHVCLLNNERAGFIYSEARRVKS